jgi:hypothetical protein
MHIAISKQTGRFALRALADNTQESGQVQAFDVSVFGQTGDSPVADKHRTDFGVAAVWWRRHFEVKNADAKTLFPIVGAAVA